MADVSTIEQEKILQTSVEELRRKYSELTNNVDQLRIKVLAFLAGELTLITFLFASGIAVPKIIYGIIFFLVGVGCIAASFIMMAMTLRSANWFSPINPSALEEHDYDKFPTHVASLEFICKCYSLSLEQNTPTYNQRTEMFDKALKLLFIGAIILLVIKYGQGVVIWHNIMQQ